MGILNRGIIADRFNNGLYKRTNCDTSNLYIDGELIRFKGMTDHNKTQRNAEEAIARDGVKYLKSRISIIETYFGKTFDRIIVFMDGKRVHNKETRVYDMDVDVGLIRCIFKEACERERYHVEQLAFGEGELQMYLQRDKLSNRNVFLTKDSDMLSILYGHKPNYRTAVTVAPKQYTSMDYETNIIDLNDDYAADVEVYDSCVWIECDSGSSPMKIYGFDDTTNRLKFSKLVFRTFCAMCGTDFTDPLLTTSMVNGFFTCIKDEELEMVNHYEMDLLEDCTNVDDSAVNETVMKNRVFQIVMLILLSGFRNRGTMKQMKKKYETGTLKNFDDLKTDLYHVIRIYYVYISLGVMLPMEVPRLKNVAHNYIKTMVHICRDGELANYKNPTVASSIYNWANNVTLQECLVNCINYERNARADTSQLHNTQKYINCKRKLVFDDHGIEDKEFSDAKRCMMQIDYKLNVKQYLNREENKNKDDDEVCFYNNCLYIFSNNIFSYLTQLAERLLDIEPIHFMDTECKSMNSKPVNDQTTATTSGPSTSDSRIKTTTSTVDNIIKYSNMFNDDDDDKVDDFEFF